MGETQRRDRLEGILERTDVGLVERARRRRGLQTLWRRGTRRTGRHPRPPREVDDRDDAAVLEIELTAVLAAVLDDESAEEAGRRAVGEREPRQQSQQR